MIQQTEEIDLFSFNFENTVTEEMLQDTLKKVIAAAKKAGNHHSFLIYKYLNSSEANLLADLQSRGYLEVWNKGRMCQLYNEYREWHDPVEVATEYRKNALDLIAKGMNAYELTTYRNTKEGPGIYEAVEHVRIELYAMLGIKHARSNINALGCAIDPQRKKNKAMIKDIHESTKDLTDWRAVEAYFKHTRFEEIGYNGDSRYVTLTPYMYKLICLAQSNSIKDVQMLVPYFGSSQTKKKEEIYRNVLLDGTIEEAASQNKQVA